MRNYRRLPDEIHRDKKLDSLIGKYVEITFFDGDTVGGELNYIPEFSEEYEYRRPHYYTCGTYSFRKSHVKRIKEKELSQDYGLDEDR